MFRGRYDTTVDLKGRTSLPVRFRDVIGSSDDSRMVITTALEPCLAVYTYGEWRRFEEKLEALPSFDPAVVQIKRLYVGGAVESAVDGHGRILIPAPLREYAGISRQVVWCGMVGYVELWDTERWKGAFSQAQGNAAQDLGKALAALGL